MLEHVEHGESDSFGLVWSWLFSTSESDAGTEAEAAREITADEKDKAKRPHGEASGHKIKRRRLALAETDNLVNGISAATGVAAGGSAPTAMTPPALSGMSKGSPSRKRKLAVSATCGTDDDSTADEAGEGYAQKMEEDEDVWGAEAKPRLQSLHGQNRRSRLPSSSRSSASVSKRDYSPESAGRVLGDLGIAPEPVLVEDMPELGVSVPDLDEIVGDMKRISVGIGVVSSSLKQEVESEFPQFTSTPFAFVPDADKSVLGPCPSLDDVHDILKNSHKCNREGDCEASWNCRVHTPLLECALDNHTYEEKVDFKNCTAATIEPDALLPELPSGLRTEPSTVDFAIHLRVLSPTVETAYHELAALSRDSFSVNHTFHLSLRFHPIAISIKTTLPGEGLTAATLQASVWAVAQFNILEELAKLSHPGSDEQDKEGKWPSFLPLIIVQGYQWILFAAVKEENRATTIYNCGTFGSTNSSLGTFQAIAGVQRLAKWARDAYEPWFMEHAPGLKQEDAM
ncbi:hypothetical protein BDY21DRAFT_198408 [Lineolata rhizophorae]|uniref:PD-(D/E)XK nuclease-like domain-containing protein n=1 Tax=Lineolata rhizophorae TaxID=578093 RepID=A0A6A6P4R3_9PEZI|nr:hypothetical protein BDY21DRAFT_198408 [Lineolata rhizophorae]